MAHRKLKCSFSISVPIETLTIKCFNKCLKHSPYVFRPNEIIIRENNLGGKKKKGPFPITDAFKQTIAGVRFKGDQGHGHQQGDLEAT